MYAAECWALELLEIRAIQEYFTMLYNFILSEQESEQEKMINSAILILCLLVWFVRARTTTNRLKKINHLLNIYVTHQLEMQCLL